MFLSLSLLCRLYYPVSFPCARARVTAIRCLALRKLNLSAIYDPICRFVPILKLERAGYGGRDLGELNRISKLTVRDALRGSWRDRAHRIRRSGRSGVANISRDMNIPGSERGGEKSKGRGDSRSTALYVYGRER